MPHPKLPTPTSSPRKSLGVGDYVEGIRRGDRAILARAITLVESRREEHRALAERVVSEVLTETGRAVRVGITGVPGAGKSTFLEALGTRLCASGHRVAVLAIDPSSTQSGGSILGDKTRMNMLATDPRAFIRPSPSEGTLGGVARKTRETMLLCEAAGYDVVFVETVGVGQSETLVDEMVDFFMLLLVAGAGDELQGIKRGVLELADLVVINKADGDNLTRVELARAELSRALHVMRPKHPGWPMEVVACSARLGTGLDEIWERVNSHRQHLEATGSFLDRRHRQKVRWMWSMVEENLLTALRGDSKVTEVLVEVESSVAQGHMTAAEGARRLLSRFTFPKAP